MDAGFRCRPPNGHGRYHETLSVKPGEHVHTTLPLFADALEGEGIREPAVALPATTEGEEVVEDYVAQRLTLRAHPVALLRDRLTPPGPASARQT